MQPQNIHLYMTAQRNEIRRYQADLATERHHAVGSDEAAAEWIVLHAEDFRRQWKTGQRQVQKES
jgi:hypothetical protein